MSIFPYALEFLVFDFSEGHFDFSEGHFLFKMILIISKDTVEEFIGFKTLFQRVFEKTE